MHTDRTSAISRHLEQRLIAYWHDVDFNWGENAAEHYTPDGLFLSQTARYEGREQIRAFYGWRRERGPRVNVHLVGNFWLKSLSDTGAEADWICTLYAHDGDPPQTSKPPIAISRVEDIYVRENDGPWLCRQRTWHSLFRGGAPTTGLTAREMARRVAGKA
ncbi:nuclear transport factor 2 family protein [Martelella soudanensis]|uniref:nuclear transport factor 2 family protein n=1 Tax=unclassified Martelella TaxID=2629616 RepID=UPI0015DECE2C|nr:MULTISPECIES: nuclear transport factor 2 family protein [unclassified Martelella]